MGDPIARGDDEVSSQDYSPFNNAWRGVPERFSAKIFAGFLVATRSDRILSELVRRYPALPA